MYALIFGTGVLLAMASYVVCARMIRYFRDSNGLRRYPGMNALAPFTNLAFMIESRKGFRSRKLHELHAQDNPVIRTGPNSLSYSDPAAIKDIYGHSSKCVKDEQYNVLSGSHTHLADVVNKEEHARKRKVLSSAYALKNLEEWEFKVADTTSRMLRQFDKLSSDQQVVDYRSWANLFALDAISYIGLSEPLGFLDAGNDKCTSATFDGSKRTVNFRECLYSTSTAQSELAWSYRNFKQIVSFSKIISKRYRKMWALAKDWDGIYLNLTNERLKRYLAGEDLEDFFQKTVESARRRIAR